MRRSRLILALAVLAATAVLFSLGMWQVRRLAWKEALIATLEIRRHGLPAPLGEIEARWRQTGDVDYMALAAAGTFRHDLEQYYYTTRDGTVGWDVFTPLQLADGRMLFVDRGFVPDADRDPATRAAGQLSGDQTVAGLARNALVEKPNRFVPDNEPANRIFYWRNLTQMAAAAGIAQNAAGAILTRCRPCRHSRRPAARRRDNRRIAQQPFAIRHHLVRPGARLPRGRCGIVAAAVAPR